MAVKLNNLKSIRKALDRSQREMSALLSVSLRAVQSYEQGWRPVPPHIQKAAALLLFLNWRKKQDQIDPCWEVMGCGDDQRACCPAYRFQAGDLCWLVSGTKCGDKNHTRWDTKIARCQKCPVTQGWLSQQTSV